MKGLPKHTIAWLLLCGSLAAPRRGVSRPIMTADGSILPGG